MFLPGRLRSTTLGDVLGRLHRAGVSGELELIGHDPPYRGCRHRISVRDGLVTAVRTPLPSPRIGELLLEHGELTPEQHRHFLLALRQGSRLAGDVLIHSGLASPQRVISALGRQNRLRLDALFTLEDADVRFHPSPPEPRATPRLRPSDFLHGRPRAREAQGPQPKVLTDDRMPRAFEVLGLSTGAPRTAVRRAFRRLASAVHPDLHPHVSDEQRRALESRFAELSSAYHTIITQRSSLHDPL